MIGAVVGASLGVRVHIVGQEVILRDVFREVLEVVEVSGSCTGRVHRVEGVTDWGLGVFLGLVQFEGV